MRRTLFTLLLIPLASAAACARTNYDLPVPRLDNLSPAAHAGCWDVQPAHETLVQSGREHRSLAGVFRLSADSTGVYDVETDAAAETTYRATLLRPAASSRADTMFWVPWKNGLLLYWRSPDAPQMGYMYRLEGRNQPLRGHWLLPGFHMEVDLDSGIVATRLDSCP